MASALGGTQIFDSVLDCTALWLYCVFAAAGSSASVHALGVVHWCATKLESVAADACSIYGFYGTHTSV